MATELAKAYVQIVPSARGIQGSITKTLGGEANAAGISAGQGFGQNLVGKLKGIIAAAGIGKALSMAVSEGAELQQNLGGTEAVFGQFAANIQSAATDAYKNMGLSASDYMATANKMESLFQGSGLEQQRALDLTSQAMQRAADVASVMGIDMEMAMESIAGAAKGNFTMMDNLGVAMNATTLEAYALEKGVNFKWNTATNAEKAELAMQMFFDRTSQYAGNFARESEDTLSGSMGAVKAAFSNVLGNLTLGKDIGPSLQALAQTVTTFLVGNLIPAVWNILKALPGAAVTFIQTAVPQLVTAFLQFLPQLQAGLTAGGPQLLQKGTELLNQLVSGIFAALPNIFQAGYSAIAEFGNSIFANLPQVLEAGKNILLNIVSGIAQMLPQLWQSAASMIASLLTGLVQNLPQILAAGFDLVVSLIFGIGNALPSLGTAAGQAARKIWDAVKNIDWLQLGKDIISGLINGIGAMAGALWDAAVNIAKSALNAIKSFFGIASPSKVMRDEVGRWIPAGVAEGIEKNTRPITSAMSRLAGLTAMPPQGRLTDMLDGSNVLSGAPGMALQPAGGAPVLQQTIYTHDSLSPAELTREAENFLARARWKNP